MIPPSQQHLLVPGLVAARHEGVSETPAGFYRDLAEVRKVVAAHPHKSTDRGLYPEDIDRLEQALPSIKRRGRVYSADGFVPNSYKWSCRIHYVEAVRQGEALLFRLGSSQAQRSRAAGNLVVIQ